MKSILERFEKDFLAIFNTMLILGIILEGENVWTYQIKKRFSEINEYKSSIPDSTLYTTLTKLEKNYELIISKEDESVQRRYFSATDKGRKEFALAKEFWNTICLMGNVSFNRLVIK